MRARSGAPGPLRVGLVQDLQDAAGAHTASARAFRSHCTCVMHAGVRHDPAYAATWLVLCTLAVFVRHWKWQLNVRVDVLLHVHGERWRQSSATHPWPNDGSRYAELQQTHTGFSTAVWGVEDDLHAFEVIASASKTSFALDMLHCRNVDVHALHRLQNAFRSAVGYLCWQGFLFTSAVPATHSLGFRFRSKP